MYMSQPVPIPDVKGKIVRKEVNGTTYIYYETGRIYDPNKKSNHPYRKVIGVALDDLPGMMLPNENYIACFPNGGNNDMTEEMKEKVENYVDDQKQFNLLETFFNQLFYEFQIQSRKRSNDTVNAYKVEKINRVLVPLRNLLKNEPYAKFLDIIEMPKEEATEDGESYVVGLSYSDVALVLTQYKGALSRYFRDR
jgi:hypothetical protein